jgi:cell wall assembly regulator SMI1
MSAFSDIETHVRQQRPKAADEAPPGATETELSELEAQVGPLTPTLRQFLQWKNGGPSDLWLGEGFWFPLSTRQIAKYMDSWRKIPVLEFYGSTASQNFKGTWPPSWIPFATWNGDVFLAVKRASGDGEIVAIDFEAQKVRNVAPSLDNFFVKVRDVITSGGRLDVDELME